MQQEDEYCMSSMQRVVFLSNAALGRVMYLQTVQAA
jgi:hypothetical protein